MVSSGASAMANPVRENSYLTIQTLLMNGAVTEFEGSRSLCNFGKKCEESLQT